MRNNARPRRRFGTRAKLNRSSVDLGPENFVASSTTETGRRTETGTGTELSL